MNLKVPDLPHFVMGAWTWTSFQPEDKQMTGRPFLILAAFMTLFPSDFGIRNHAVRI